MSGPGSSKTSSGTTPKLHFHNLQEFPHCQGHRQPPKKECIYLSPGSKPRLRSTHTLTPKPDQQFYEEQAELLKTSRPTSSSDPVPETGEQDIEFASAESSPTKSDHQVITISSSSSEELEDEPFEDIEVKKENPTSTKMSDSKSSVVSETHEEVFKTTEYRVQEIQNELDRHLAGTQKMVRAMAALYVRDLTDIKSDIDVLQRQCFLYEDDEEDPEKAYQTLALAAHRKLSIKYRKAVVAADEILASLTTSGGGSRILMPKSEPPSFSGKTEDFSSFKDQFTSLVVNNTSLSATDKLILLKQSLAGGTANPMVNKVDLTDGNWLICWSALQTRYDNKRDLAHSHLKNLFNMTTMTKQTPRGLLNLVDTVNAVSTSLKSMGLDVASDGWEIMVTHLVLKNLDKRSKIEFEKSIKNNDFHKLQVLLDFLTTTASAVSSTDHVDSKSEQKQDGKSDQHQNSSDTKKGQSENSPSSKKKRKHEQGKNSSNSSVLATVQNANAKRDVCRFCDCAGHFMVNCKKFLNLSPSSRGDAILGKFCSNCLSPRHTKVNECTSKLRCTHCSRKHHSLLHRGSRSTNSVTQVSTISPPAPAATAIAHSSSGPARGLLPTAIVLIKHRDKSQLVRALIDTGSQVSIVSEHIVQLMNLPRSKNNVQTLTGPGASVLTPAKGIATFEIHSTTGKWKTTLDALIFAKVTSNLPYQSFAVRHWDHLKHLQLADPHFNESAPVDLLLGADIADQVMGQHRLPGPKGTPSAHLTSLGWLVYGSLPTTTVTHVSSINTLVQDDNFHLQRFWETEELHTSKPMTNDERECEEKFVKTIVRQPSGRYSVDLPFKGTPPELGDSRNMALKRWMSVERRLSQNPDLKEQYDKFMTEYIELGHMEPLSYFESCISRYRPYYAPHHPVIKESSSSTKLRVVYDCSAKTTSGLSLNDILLVGPTVQSELVAHVMKFRLFKVALSSDIVKMFRQILIADKDQDYQRILWRKNPNEPIVDYRLKTITYGMSPSPFLATRTLNQLAADEAENYPLASAALANNFYVDDLLSGASSTVKAIELQKQLIACCATAGLDLRKWSSNDSAVLNHLPLEYRETKLPLIFGQTQDIKTLGIQWNPATDTFSFHTIPKVDENPTKRNVLSVIARTFDPLGWLSPCTIKAKIIMQQVWLQQIEWDEQVSGDTLNDWIHYVRKLHTLSDIQIHRYVHYHAAGNFEFHGFSDASEKAFSAVVYLRGLHNGKYTVELISAKTRVAPLKTISVPRLELSAAVLLVRLMKKVQHALQIKANTFYWTDSSIVLHWLESPSNRWKTFIANRVAEVQESSLATQWRHVSSEFNPADCASRGIYPDELKDHLLWWHGPLWLLQKELPVRFIPGSIDVTQMEQKPVVTGNVTTQEENQLLQHMAKFSSWMKMKRVMCYVIRFISRIRKSSDPKLFYSSVQLEAHEYAFAATTLTRLVQEAAFADDIHKLKSQGLISTKGQLRNLNPFYDSKSALLKVGGRLSNSALKGDQKHPIILPRNSPVVRAMILDRHKQMHHAGTQGILNDFRLKYWLLHGRRTIDHVIRNCLICFRFKAKSAQQQMGNLPSARVNKTRAFVQTGIDYAGPFMVRDVAGKRPNVYKAWIALFTCLTTRAIHLELVTEMSHETFLLAFKRFISRRGKPDHIFSDHGTNFVGANNKLIEDVEIVSTFQNQEIANEIASEGITWKFIPPSAPHFGGCWEAGVKLFKTHLKKMLLMDSYTFEEFETMLTQVEAVVNSRPLLPLSNDPNDLEALTPAHFLIGSSLLVPPEPDVTHLPINRLNRYQMIQRKLQKFWARWSLEYLVSLQTRNKWQTPEENFQVGDLVLILEDYLPPLKWRLGRVKTLHPGKDGLVRATTIETEGFYEEKKGKMTKRIKEFVRPIVKLARLPKTDDELDSVQGNDKKEASTKRIVKSSAQQTSLLSFLLHLMLMIFMFGTCSSEYQWNPNYWDTFPHCSTQGLLHHEIPSCTKSIQWLTIQEGGLICVNRFGPCPANKMMISSNMCGSTIDSPCENRALQAVHFDDIQCQVFNDVQKGLHLEYLTTPSELTSYCAVGGKTTKTCPHFTQQIDKVPVVILQNVVFPVKHLNIEMATTGDKLDAFACDTCNPADCVTGDCSGDTLFCASYPCNSTGYCRCEYNRKSETYMINTADGLLKPECWGYITTVVQKEDRSKATDAYLCPTCDIVCTTFGITVQSPRKIPSYVRATKNPGHISMITDSKTTDMYFTKNQLAGTGNITIEVWYRDYDSPTVFMKNCPRIPVCDLIQCYFCYERIGNFSCYTMVHWTLVTLFGILVATILMTILWLTKIVFFITWILFYPFRLCLQKVIQRTRTTRVRFRSSVNQDPEDPNDGTELIERSGHRTTTRQTRRKIGRHLPAHMSILMIFHLIGFGTACTNSAILTATGKECHQISNGRVVCSIRVNTRIELSPISQLACFQIYDNSQHLLGSLTLETREVTLKCLKQSLYFAPRAVGRCQSSRQCYNLYSTAECTGHKCQEFSTNSTISHFEPSMKQLGWNFCQSYYEGYCFWIMTRNCHFYRIYLDNPTNEYYELFNCPEFRFQASVIAKFTSGNSTNQTSLRLTAGETQEFHGMRFSLISASTPPMPILSKCIIKAGQQSALADCNLRHALTVGRLGEIQCGSIKAAQNLDHTCMASINIIRAIVDDAGIKCISELMDPKKALLDNALPLKIAGGTLLSHEDSIKFEASISTLLEVQVESDNLQFVKQFTATTCVGSFVKITGCYSCLTGSTLTIEAKVNEEASLATFVCTSIGFYAPLHLSTDLRKYQIILKLDQSNVNLQCALKCSSNSVPMTVTGTLDYLSDTEGRAFGMSVSYRSTNTTTGFEWSSLWSGATSWLSIFDFSISRWILKIIIGIILILIIVFTLIMSVKLVLRKLL